MIRVEHACVVHELRPDGSRGRRTAIDKRPVDGPVQVGQGRGWVKRFTALGRPGGLAEVLTPGTVRAGDEITVLDRPTHGLTLGEAFGAMPADKAVALLAAHAPGDLQPDIRHRAQAAAGLS